MNGKRKIIREESHAKMMRMGTNPEPNVRYIQPGKTVKKDIAGLEK
jgi:hypothetical protein